MTTNNAPPNGLAQTAKAAIQNQQTTTAIARQGTTRKELQDLLKSMEGQIKAALPKHITPERIIRVALTAVSRTPKLLECSKESLLGSIIQASQLGLEPDSVLGQAYLVPFYNGKTKRMECQFIPGYRGYVDLARRSGNIESIMAQVVREKDTFEFEFGLSEKLRHVPSTSERGEITYVYAYARFTNGGYAFEVMSRADVDKVMAKSKSRDSAGNVVGPWATDYEPMARKTVIRRLAKYLPLSVEFAKALTLDEMAAAGAPQGLDVSKIDVATGEIPADFTIELDTNELHFGEEQKEGEKK